MHSRTQNDNYKDLLQGLGLELRGQGLTSLITLATFHTLINHSDSVTHLISSFIL